MKIFLRILAILVIIFAVAVISLLIYVKSAFPKVGPPPDLKVEITPERVQRGKYLAHHVAVCIDCHSTRDWTKFGGPLVEDSLGKGGEAFTEDFGFPGTFYARNITPYALKDWSDGEVFRAVTAGVSRDGEPLFPVMPHHNFGQMDKEDIYSIIAYVRSLPAVKNDIPPSEPKFPMSLIMRTIPKEGTFSKIPDKKNKVAYGKYMLTMASCNDCHTKQIKGEPVAGMSFAGGFEFKLPNHTILRSANITPDKETGIGNWTEEMFIARFKSYVDSSYVPHTVKDGELQTLMPWTMYGNMETEDLSAIFAYLQTVTPVKNQVTKFEKWQEDK